MRGAWTRHARILASPSLAGVSAAATAVGVIVYVAMLLMTFDLGVRLREAAIAVARDSEEVARMEVMEQEQEAQFAVRHQAFLERMEHIAVLKYLAPGGPAVSEARSATASPR